VVRGGGVGGGGLGPHRAEWSNVSSCSRAAASARKERDNLQSVSAQCGEEAGSGESMLVQAAVARRLNYLMRYIASTVRAWA